jgi:hypothetical protein
MKAGERGITPSLKHSTDAQSVDLCRRLLYPSLSFPQNLIMFAVFFISAALMRFI